MSAKIASAVGIKDMDRIPARIWLIWLCGALFYFYQFILRVSPGVMTDHLMQSFSVQACALGVLSGFYYNAYALMQVPVGLLIDRFGPRRLMTAGLTMCVLGTVVFASASYVSWAAGGRLMMGVGSAFAYVGTLKIATLWFPRDYVGRVIGLTMVFGTLGGVSGGAPLGYLIDHVGWRQAMLLLAIGGIGLAITAWVLVRDRPQQLGYTEVRHAEYEVTGIWDGLLKVMTSAQVWLIGIYAGLMYVPLSAFADLWGVPFIVEAYQVDRKLAASAISMILLGICIGSPVTAYFSDRMRSRKFFMIVSAISSTVVYGLLIYLSHIPLPLMYALLFLGGLSFTGQVLCFAAVTELMPLSASGVAIGVINMIVMLSGVIFEPLVGWLLEYSWLKSGGTFINGVPHYSVEAFRFALLPLPISLGLSLLLTRFIKETYPRQ